VCLRAGIRRVILANQPIGQSANACFQALRDHPNLELYVLADSVEGVGLLARAASDTRSVARLRILVEIGAVGARTGCRDVGTAVAVAKAIVATPTLMLAGIEAFEGILHETEAVSGLMQRVVETATAIDRLGLFSDDVVLTAGGSKFFDLVASELEPAALAPIILGDLKHSTSIAFRRQFEPPTEKKDGSTTWPSSATVA
jgi:D-serine dehydratase